MRFRFLSSNIAALSLLAAAGAAVLAGDARYQMNADGVTYLDMASETLRHGPANLINGTWGPLFPALIAACLRLFRPSPSGEYLAVHFLNWLIFVGATASFGFFLKSWLLDKAGDPSGLEPERKRALIPFGFVLFFWSVSEVIGLGTATPDLLVVAFVFLSAGIACRLLQASANSRMAAVLGLILAFGYFAKPAMFAMALMALITLLGFAWSERAARNQVGIAAIVFLLLSAPFVAVMSQHVGRLSISENATLNYAAWVGRPDVMEVIRSGALAHPPRVLSEKPVVLEFATPLPGTYPLHNDPSYWSAGTPIHFSLRNQIRTIIENLRVAGGVVLALAAACGGVISLLVLARPGGKQPPSLGRSQYWLPVWCLFVCGTFALVHLEPRFIAPFLVLLCLSAYRALMGNIDRVAESAVLLTVSIVILIPVALGVAKSGWHIVRDATLSRKDDGIIIADAIRGAGLYPGDYVAVVGSGYDSMSYARLAGVRIVVEIPDQNAFWNLSPSQLVEVRNRLKDVHVKALLNASSTARSGDSGWTEVEGLRDSQFRISLLPRTP